MNKIEIKRIHFNWWGQCRSCRFWGGEDGLHSNNSIAHRWNPGPCNNPLSPLFREETWTEGYCEKWDAFDLEIALEIMREIDEKA